MNSRYTDTITMNNQTMGSHMNLHKIRSDFSELLLDERRNGNYNSDRINHYQYHLGVNQLQCLDDGFKDQVENFKRQGLKLHKVKDIDVDEILGEYDRYNVEYIKLLIYRDDNNQKVVGGIRDGLSVSLGYLPSDYELTMTEVKFKPYIR